MKDKYNKYELLAIALEPRFGNIYEYNLEPDQIAGYDVQAWTPELREAVKDYLLHHCPADVFAGLFVTEGQQPIAPEDEETAVDALLDTSEPWLVAFEVRNVAVSLVPTLHQLIGHLTDWTNEDDRIDAVTWLETHHDDDESWRAMASFTRRRDLLPVHVSPRYSRNPGPDDLAAVLTPPELLDAWKYVFSPAKSNLTDEEWRLLEPHFGPVNSPYGMHPRSTAELRRKRRIFDAIRFKMAHDLPWRQLPSRYPAATYQTYRHYKADGLFSRLYEALRGNPDAGRIVEWLEQIVNDDKQVSSHHPA